MDKQANTIGVGLQLAGSFAFGGQTLFSDLDLVLPAKKWTCLLGISGVGKSTILRLIADLESGGEFSGEVVADDGLSVSNRLSYMAQSDLLFPWLTVRQNIALGNMLRQQSVDQARVEALLASVGLIKHADKKPAQLSGGMRQRTALARTLMEDTPLVLLDEPFSALDARTRSDMQELAFSTLQDKTVLLVTHDSSEAVRLGHQLLVMSESGLKQHDLPGSMPIRAIDDAEMLASQAALTLSLRN